MDAKKRTVFSWALYDWANSAYATSVLSVIFNVYFSRSVVPAEGVRVLGLLIPGESLWSYTVSAAMAVVIVLSLWLGALADEKGTKRMQLMSWAVLGALATLALVGAVPGRVAWAVTFGFLSMVGFEMSLVFYNAFLNDISSEKDAGWVSGLGFALGYIGGGLCLAINLLMIGKPAWFGLANGDASWPIRASMLLVGAWWLVFSLPTFFWVRDVPRARATPTVSAAKELLATVQALKSRPDLYRFLVSYLIYNDGIQTVILMASIFGAKIMGLSTAQLGLCFLMIQFVAFFSSLVWGKWADTSGHKRVLVVTVVVFTLVAFWGVVMKRPWEFWVLGAVVGSVLGGSQAISRSLYSLLIPPDKTTEFFALFSIVGKAGSLLGPFVFGVSSQLWGLRAAVGALALFFVVGGGLLLFVNEERGRALAKVPS